MSCVKNRVEHDFLRRTGQWGSAMEVHLLDFHCTSSSILPRWPSLCRLSPAEVCQAVKMALGSNLEELEPLLFQLPVGWQC